jgi:glycosyltransferase involved in cell wall biosynthesis
MTAYDGPTLVVSHPFALTSLTGTTVLLRALLQEMCTVNPGTCATYLNLDEHTKPGASLARLRAAGGDGLQFLGVNLHIERHQDRSVECFETCHRMSVPAYLWVHDYWPHHEPIMRRLVEELGVILLASTSTVRDGLAGDNFSARVVQVGISLANLVVNPAEPPRTGPFVVGAAGRLVKRKRLMDVVGAFRLASLGADAELRLRLLPSLVFKADDDAALLDEVMDEVAATRTAGARIVVARGATAKNDYGAYSAYVCASDYEGFSMTPIEAIYCGCPAFLSDIPAHRAIAGLLHPNDSQDILYPVGDLSALAALIRDEAITRRRAAQLWSRSAEIRSTVEANLSIRGMAQALLYTLGHR